MNQKCSCAKDIRDSACEKRPVAPTHLWPVYVNQDHDSRKDHFVERDEQVYAGTHLIIDLWGVERVDDLTLMEKTLRKAVDAAGATLLHIHLHHFTPNGGISGVAVLAESHISVHTWPERSFAAFDIFMCGNSRPEEGLKIIEQTFSPNRMDVKRYIRGKVVTEHEKLQGKTL